MDFQYDSLEIQFARLKELCTRIAEEELDQSQFDPPASEEQILDWERANDITIPDSYKKWLMFSNGSIMMGTTAKFFGLMDIEVSNEYIPEDLIVIGELVGDGELLCFTNGTQKIVRFLDGRRKELNSIEWIIQFLIEMAKDALHITDENQSDNEGNVIKGNLSDDATAKLLAIFEAKKLSPQGLSKEQEKVLADIQSSIKGGE